MNAVVVDTHTAIWYLLQSPKLSETAQKAIDSASKIYISSVTIIEIIYLTEKGRIPQLVDVIQSWLDEEDENEQQETGNYLIEVLDQDRLGDSPLFPAKLKGISW